MASVFTEADFQEETKPRFTEADFQEEAPISAPLKLKVSPYDQTVPGRFGERLKPESGMEPGTELTSAVASDPVGFLKSIPGDIGSALMAPGRVGFAGAADIASKLSSNSPGGNIAAMERGESEIPADKAIAETAKTNPNLAVVANLGKSAAQLAPMAGLGAAPAWFNRMLAAGFSAQMIAGAPEQARQLGEEMGKPKDQQDAGKIASLKSDLIQTGVFAPLAGAGAANGLIKPRGEFQGPLATGKVLKTPEGSAVPPKVPFNLPDAAPKPEATAVETAAQESLTPALKFGRSVLEGGKNHNEVRDNHIDKVGDPVALITESGKDENHVFNHTKPDGTVETIDRAAAGKVYDRLWGNDPGTTTKLDSAMLKEPKKSKAPTERPAPVEDAAGRLQQLKAFTDRTPEETTEMDALLTRDKAQKNKEAWQAQFKADLEKQKAAAPAPAPPAAPVETPAAAEPAPAEPVPAGQLGGGAANLGEVASGANEDIMGVRQVTREKQAAAGQPVVAEPNEGVNLEQSLADGRTRLSQDPASANRAATELEQGRVSAAGFNATRAKYEQVMAQGRRTAEQFGTNSPEYDAARMEAFKWSDITKRMQTEWHKLGQGQQGETDIDTGNLLDLETDYHARTGKEWTPYQRQRGAKVAKSNKDAQGASGDAQQKFNDHIQSKATGGVADAERRASDAAKKTVREWAVKVAEAENKSRIAKTVQEREVAKIQEDRVRKGLEEAQQNSRDAAVKLADAENKARVASAAAENENATQAKAAKDALDAANKAVRENAIRLAESENKARTAQAGRDKAAAMVQVKAARKALEAASDSVRSAAIKMAAAENKSRVDVAADARGVSDQTKAERDALDAANKTVRENAIRVADAENKARVAAEALKQATEKIQTDASDRASKAGRKTVIEADIRAAQVENKARVDAAKRAVDVAEVQRKAAQKAADATSKTVREAAADLAAKERKLQGDPTLRVWTKAKEYLDKGIDKLDDIRKKLATDLGMSIEQVTRLMAQDKRANYLANDLWRKQQTERNLKNQAKRWVDNLSTPGLKRALDKIPRAMFVLKVGLHGTVALGTHAPTVLFQPRFWNAYVRNFAKMYHMVGRRAYYENQIQGLMRRDNYITARRAGLVNDPFVNEEYAMNPVVGKVAQIAPKTAAAINAISGMGNRGYSVLKILRQDMFDQHWDQLPKSAQIPEMAQAISDGINHATGVVQGMAPPGTNLALFAPRLEASRVMWLAGDPIKATGTLLNWKNASQGEKYFAMNQLKEKAWVVGTFGSLLALNQGVLSASDSKQKVNVTDPFKPDFLKFKAAGMNVSYGNPMITMARLPLRLFVGVANEGKFNKIVYEDENVATVLFEYVRSQMSPFAGTATDLAIGRDFMRKPLPRAAFGLLPGKTNIPKRLQAEGIKPYTWAEYTAQQAAMIPLQEALKEVWGKDLAMTPEARKHALDALATIIVMGGTGARMSEDYSLKQKK